MDGRVEKQKSEIKYKFTNQLMFAIVMRDEDLCRELLQRIMPERTIREIRFPDNPLVNVEYLETEKTLIPGLHAKSVRLDVLFEDSDAWNVIEMQVEDTGELPKRSSYYHAVLAVQALKRGKKYDQLKSRYVIFICMFDLFGLDEPMYRFQMRDEKNSLPLGDEQYTLILNADCSPENRPEKLRTFYAYLKDETVEENDDLIREIHLRVKQANQMEGVQELMTVQEELDLRDRRLKQAEEKAQQIEAKARQAEADAASEKKLTCLLLKENRVEDLKRAMEDTEYQKELMKEYNLQ